MSAAPEEISIEHNGQTVRGRWEVVSGAVRVHAFFATKATQIGGMRPEALARILLAELAGAEEERKRREAGDPL